MAPWFKPGLLHRVIIRTNQDIRCDLALLAQLDHVQRRRVSRSSARLAFHCSLKLPNRRVGVTLVGTIAEDYLEHFLAENGRRPRDGVR